MGEMSRPPRDPDAPKKPAPNFDRDNPIDPEDPSLGVRPNKLPQGLKLPEPSDGPPVDAETGRVPDGLVVPKHLNGPFTGAPRSNRFKITNLQAAFIEWLVTPPRLRDPQTQEKWMERHGVNKDSGNYWKSLPNFVKAWNQRLRSLQVDPANVDAVISAMREKALAGDVKAQVEWLKIAREFSPLSMEPDDDPQDQAAVSDLSDGELAALIAEAASSELEARQGSDG